MSSPWADYVPPGGQAKTGRHNQLELVIDPDGAVLVRVHGVDLTKDLATLDVSLAPSRLPEIAMKLLCRRKT